MPRLFIAIVLLLYLLGGFIERVLFQVSYVLCNKSLHSTPCSVRYCGYDDVFFCPYIPSLCCYIRSCFAFVSISWVAKRRVRLSFTYGCQFFFIMRHFTDVFWSVYTLLALLHLLFLCSSILFHVLYLLCMWALHMTTCVWYWTTNSFFICLHKPSLRCNIRSCFASLFISRTDKWCVVFGGPGRAGGPMHL